MHNNDLARTLDTSDEWIFSHTGIRTRHIAENASASDLGAQAAVRALSQAGVLAHEVDLIVVATSTPDYGAFPSTACVIQRKLGIARCAAYDISAACSGFVFALSSAVNAIRCGEATTALVIGSEIFSSILDWSDRSTCILFGDGAGAALIRARQEDRVGPKGQEGQEQSDVLASFLDSRAQDYESLTCAPAFLKNAPRTVVMDGKKVYDFAVASLVETVEALAQKQGIAASSIDHIVPHQANSRIIYSAAKRLGLPKEKFFLNIEKYANTSSASIPIALAEMLENGVLRRGDLVALAGFGAGLTCGGVLVRW